MVEDDKRKTIGILMLETTFPRVVGDIGNEDTFAIPVVRKIVHGATSENVVKYSNERVVDLFVETAKELEDLGVCAITTSCGFVAEYQRKIASELRVPFFSSSLVLLNLIDVLIGEKKIVGILTARKSSLKERHFKEVGASNVSYVVYGMEGTHFSDIFVENEVDLDYEMAKKDVVDVAKKMVKEHKNVGAILLECTNMSPFKEDIKKEIHMPIFDICTFVEYIYSCI